MAPINHLGFHLGTYKSALAADITNENFKSSGWLSSECYPDFPLQHPLSIKTLIGHKLSDLELHSPEYLIGTKLSDGHDGFLVLLGNSDGLPITIPQLLSKALHCLLEMYQAEYQIRGDEITYSCCIGIPIYFTHIQRSIVHDAARQAGFTSIALVHETTAAALELEYKGLLDYPYVVLVDMGVISMHVCVVKYRKDTGPQILSHAFDMALGGRAFDMVLLNHFVVKFRDEHGIDATNDSDLYWKLYSVCEKMKIELSSCEDASFEVCLGFFNKLIGSMKREEYERMCAPLLERVKGPLEKALDNAGLSVEDIHSVQCVGLASQVPSIIKKLTDFFGRNPVHAVSKHGLVSYGCSEQNYYTSHNMISYKIKDIFPYSIVMSWNTKDVTIEGEAVVFPKGGPMEDTTKEISFSASATFSVGFKYSDIVDPMITTRIGRFEIGPFQSKSGAKVPGKFSVTLDKSGIFGVESAYILKDPKKVLFLTIEDGNKVELQMSRLDGLHELAGELNQQEQLYLREKLEKTEHLLIKGRERRKQLEAQVLESSNELSKFKRGAQQHEQTKNELNLLKKEAEDASQQNQKAQKELLDTYTQLQEIKTLLAIEKEKSKEIEGELTKFKREARNESQQHEQTKNELNEHKSLLATEKEKRINTEINLDLLKKEAHEVSQCNEKAQKELLDTSTRVLEIKRLLALEKETSKKIKDELSKFKREADEPQQHEQTKNELMETRNLLETEKEKSTKLDHELRDVKIELEKQKKLAEFSYSELIEATNDFNDANKIGQGGFGCVYKGVIHCTSVAIKVLKVLNEENNQGEREFNQEVETLQMVRHPNLVVLIGACREKYALVYEFLPNGNLENCLKNVEDRKSLSWRKRIRIASNICSALIFLHRTKPHGIVHGDLKPANILLDSTYTCKLSDFGICRPLNITDTTITPHYKTAIPKGTFCYIDPEYLETGRVTIHNDVFPFGVVLLQLVTGKEAMALRMLVEDALDSDKLNEVVDVLANWPLNVAERMAQLGLRCMDRYRKNRPDLEKEVWIEIESLEQVASCS